MWRLSELYINICYLTDISSLDVNADEVLLI